MAGSPTVGSTRSFVHEGLGNSSYLLDVGGGAAVVIDPDRRAAPYLAAAAGSDLHIVAVVETHLHADFITGALEVRAATGAAIYAPAEGGVAYEHREISGGDRLTFGDVEIEARATPGHSPEHLAFVARRQGAPASVFTGGALIVGGAARTDLVTPELTESLTRSLFGSRKAFDDLGDETIVMPTHGGGSFCSVGAGSERVSTLGVERRGNSVLTYEGTEDEFVRWFPSTFPGTPTYYFRMRARNAAGPQLMREIARPRAIPPTEFAAAATEGIVVDVRGPAAFAAGHVPRSLAIPWRDSYCVWLGWLVPEHATLWFVTGDEDVDDVVEESMLVGFESFGGWLRGGMDAWLEAGLPVSTAALIQPGEIASGGPRPTLIDVREPNEVKAGAVDDALAIPLGQLASRSGEIDRTRPAIVYCAAGERSITAASILERAGVPEVASLDGGYGAWRRHAAGR